jgi:catalase
MQRTALMLAALGLASSPALAQGTDPVPAIVDLMQTFAGKGNKVRPSGAKGQCYTGTFEPSADGKRLSASLVFNAPSKVLARFSVGGGNPKVADTNKAVNRGFSFKLDHGGRGETEFVMVNAPVNFVKSPEQMLGFLQARVPGADGKQDPVKVKAFTDANPETTNQGKYLAAQPLVGSWVGVAYWGVHAYTLTDAAGANTVVKFKMVPKAGTIGLTDDEAKTKPADFLADELAARIAAKGETAFDMVAIMGRAGDPTNDPTIRWADEDARPTTTLGTLRITAVEDNKTCDGAVFDPQNLAKGIAGPKDDPIFPARSPAYAISITGRS